MFDKVNNWASQINWKRFLVRAKFVLSHSLVGGVVAGVAALVYLVGGVFGVALFAGLSWLVAKEVGEIVGKSKAAGTFENNFQGNKEAFIDAIDDKWQLWQTVGAMAIVAAVILFLRAWL